MELRATLKEKNNRSIFRCSRYREKCPWNQREAGWFCQTGMCSSRAGVPDDDL